MINTISLYLLPILIITILTIALVKKVPIYEEFTEGAKDGFTVSIKIIPYLVAIIVGISMFRASGAMESITNFLSPLLSIFSIPVDSIPVMITRPLSGSATLGLFSEIAHKFGPDAYTTKLCAVLVGSSETTFYVLSVYFGSIGIKKFRYALLTGLLADVIGIIVAIFVCSLIFLPKIA
ncbi:spore maturation protein [bacterium]|nr:spore maturation protein [bacterium]